MACTQGFAISKHRVGSSLDGTPQLNTILERLVPGRTLVAIEARKSKWVRTITFHGIRIATDCPSSAAL